MSRRWIVAVAVVVLMTSGLPIAGAGTSDDRAYDRNNVALDRTVPGYPRARLRVRERISGTAGATSFQAIQRIYVLGHRTSQAAVTRYYAQHLGVKRWRVHGETCLISGRRGVVVLVSATRRRLGVVIDSRGATLCRDHAADLKILLELNYPD
jgi:hypothetical protein